LGAIHDLWRRHRDEVTFVIVYIAEIHPTDGWEVTDNRIDGVAFAQPTTMSEREDVAAVCALNLAIEIPVVIDEMDNRLADSYGGLPDRLYLIGTGGTVDFQGALGPGGFVPAALEAAIEQALA
jgi:iodothyronine deiodinase-like protein